MKRSTSAPELTYGSIGIPPLRRARLPARRAGVAVTVVYALPLVLTTWLGGWIAFVLTLVALVGGTAAFMSAGLGIVCVTLLLPATRHFEVLGVSVTPLDAAVGGAALGFLAAYLFGSARMAMRGVHWAWVAFLVAAAVSTLGPVDNADRVRELAFWGALAVVFYAVSVLRNEDDRRWILLALCAAAAFEASYALFEYFSRLSDRFVRLEGAIVYPLPEGTLVHANSLGAFLVVAAVSILALGLAERGWVRRLALASALLCAAGTAVTFSRGAWVSLALAGAVFVFDRSTRRVSLVALFCLIAVGGALLLAGGNELGARATSLYSAVSTGDLDELYGIGLELARRGIEVVGAHPVTGVGEFEESGMYAGRIVEASHPHNLFVGLAVFYGIPAALAFVAVIGLVARSALARLRAARNRFRAPNVGGLAVVVAIVVNGLFEYPLWNASLTVLLVLALAVAARLPGADEAGVAARTSG